MDDRESLVITHMEVKDFLGIKFVDVDLSTGLVAVTGKNAQGKSSFLKAIEAVFGGQKACPDRPIRDGRRRAEVVARTSRYTIARRWFDQDRSYLELTDSEGTKLSRPQAILDRLVGELTFDPLDFITQKPAAQAATLRHLARLDFADLDQEVERCMAERTEVGRAVKQLEGQLAGIPHDPDVPEREISLPELAEEMRQAAEDIAANNRARSLLNQHKVSLASHEKSNLRLREKIAELQRELAEGEARVEALHEMITALDLTVRSLQEPDTHAINRKIEEAERTNRRVRAQQERRALLEMLHANESHYRELTEAIDMSRQEKVARLAAASFPIAGLSLDVHGDGATYRGRPINQASTSEALRIGLEIGAALNPTLRTILIHRGESLDPDGWKLVAQWARERDYQVIAEKVTDGSPEGIVMKNGQVETVGVSK